MASAAAGCAGKADEAKEFGTSSPELRRDRPCPDGQPASVRYRVTELGSLAAPSPSSDFVAVGRLNEKTQIVGTSFATGPSGLEFHAFLWQRGKLRDLGTAGGPQSGAKSINHAGLIVGSSQLAGSFDSHAFVWHGRSMEDLGTLGGRFSEASDVNERRQIVGFAQIAGADAPFHAFLHDRGRMRDLGTLGGAASFATAINEASQVVGYAEGALSGVVHAFVWQNGVMTAVLGEEQESHAYDINERGEIVGDVGGVPHAFLYSDGQLTMIGPSEAVTFAFAINDLGAVVGVSSHDRPQRPDLSGPEGYVSASGQFQLLRDLTDSCWVAISPSDINDHGQIAAIAYPCEGELRRHALLLDPTRSCGD